MIYFVDFETRSRSPIKEVGARNYVADPSTEAVFLAIVREDGRYAWVWSPFQREPLGYMGDPPGLEECELIEGGLPTFGPGDMLCAHNAEDFDRPVWEALGLPSPPGGWLDSMPRARRASLPGKLENLCAYVLGVGKDKEARKVTLSLSKPVALSRAAVDACRQWAAAWWAGAKDRAPPPAVSWILGPPPWEKAAILSLAEAPPYGCEVLRDPDPAQLTAVGRYCLLDAALLRMVWIKERLGEPNVDDPVLAVSDTINRRGVKVDLDLVDRLLRAADRVVRQASERAAKASEGKVTEATLRSTAELRAWLKTQGVDLPDVKAETVRAAMAEMGLALECSPTPLARESAVYEVLAARLDVARVSAGKLRAARARTSADGRLRGAYGYAAAHTWRWNSRGMQIHNLPRPVKGTPVLP